MGILDAISGMGYDVRRVEPVKVQDAGLLTDAELEADYEGEEAAYREYLADPAPHPVDYQVFPSVPTD